MNILLQPFKNNKANLSMDDDAQKLSTSTIGIIILTIFVGLIIGTIAMYKTKSEENQKMSIDLINKQQTTIIQEK